MRKRLKPVNESVLRERYERIVGKVSRATWYRIRSKYKLEGEGIGKVVFIESLAHLRLLNPHKNIQRRHVEKFMFIKANLPQITCTGWQLLFALKGLYPVPSDETIRRWGHQIGVPLYKSATYSENEVQRWVLKIASQVNFEFKDKDARNTKDITRQRSKRRGTSRKGCNSIKW